MSQASHFKHDRDTSTAAADRSRHDQADGKKYSVSRIISNILLVVGVALLVVAGAIWFQNNQRYEQNEENNQKLAEYASLPQGDDGAPEIDWDALRAINQDVVGWIYIPHTVVNYPVYQGQDNDYYLDHSAYGQYSFGGQIFMDYENTAPGLVDMQTLIYGHHQRNGSMFKTIADMASQDAFDAVSTIWYCTPEANYELEPLLLYKTVGSDTSVRTFNFPPNEFHEYLSEKLAVASAARGDAQDIITVTNHVLTLATCQYDEDDGRSILLCVLKSEVQGGATGQTS
ncbi:MAG: class B sortase [Atopobiaceae bacterium]|jgi:sortase B